MRISKRLLALLMSVLLISAILPAISTFAAEVVFPLKTGENVLVANEDTLFVTLLKQDPDTKLITATIQIQQSAASSEGISFRTIGIAISFSGKAAPFSYNSVMPDLFPPGQIDVDTPNVKSLFAGYTKALINDFSDYSSQFIRRDANSGGVLGTMLSGSGMNPPLVVDPGQTVDIAEFYFMPVSGDMLDIDMFGFTFLYEPFTFTRVTNFIGNGTYLLEASSMRLSQLVYTFVVNPGSFKLHIQQPQPKVSANNSTRTIAGYNLDTMEWSYNEAGPYSGGLPLVGGEACTVYVRGKGSADYSGNNEPYTNYKKYIAGSPTPVTFEAGEGLNTYIVTFDGNGGSPALQLRVVVENTAVGAENMPDDPIHDGFTFTGWGKEKNGTGTEFSPATVVTADITVYAQWAADTPPAATITGRVSSYNPRRETKIDLYMAGTKDLVASAIIEKSLTGSDQITQEFKLFDVPEGIYDLVVSKETHLNCTILGVPVGVSDLDLTTNPNAFINTISLPCGDINGDGFINSSDLSIIILPANYNKHISDPGVDPKADLTGTGWVNPSVVSIIILPANYNKTHLIYTYQ